MKKILGPILLLFLLSIFAGLIASHKAVIIPTPISTASPVATSSAVNQVLGIRKKTSGCITQNALPDIECTPGAIIAGVTKEQVCTAGYSKRVRNVPESEKEQVYSEYGIISHQTGEYEVDHHISLELGGSNEISNLWPEPAEPKPGFHEKDKVENYLHKQVCDGVMTLEQARQQISSNWLEVYQKLSP